MDQCCSALEFASSEDGLVIFDVTVSDNAAFQLRVKSGSLVVARSCWECVQISAGFFFFFFFIETCCAL